MKSREDLTVLARDVLILTYVTIASSTLSFFLPRSSSKIWDFHWGPWIRTFQQHGLVGGFYAVNDVYPPLTFSLLAFVSTLPGDTYLNFKLAQILFTFASALLILVWRRNIVLAVGAYLALVPNSIIFDSVDIFFTPFLIGALIAASKRRWAWFSALYVAACLVKFQPVVLAPFFLIWAVRDLQRWRTWLLLVVPACLVLLPVVVVFGPQFPGALFRAFGASSFFSGDAYNLNWLTGSIYGLANFPDATAFSLMPIMTDPRIPRAMWRIAQLTSYASFIFIVALSYFSPRSPTNLFMFCGFGMLSYFMLHTEVHENHLHIVVVCFAVLAAVSPRHIPTFLFWSGAQAVNLMQIFTGWTRTVAGLEWTLLISIFNVIMFIALYFDIVKSVVNARAEDRRNRLVSRLVDDALLGAPSSTV
ncbi:hypothetical protein [Bradyrhizobium sp. S69]|uniref:hypothetical protein n=1 Tax=Bradyrhizobium sp. S69 TaxID=1641856 RepID=UPI00131D540F|nr:hypothetical protein [Bradyrhizobium sp. S69]